jgi:hypothetical protein
VPFSQVDRPARGRGDHGQPAGERLLDRLAERLVRSRVREDVEAGEEPGKLATLPGAEE